MMLGPDFGKLIWSIIYAIPLAIVIHFLAFFIACWMLRVRKASLGRMSGANLLQLFATYGVNVVFGFATVVTSEIWAGPAMAAFIAAAILVPASVIVWMLSISYPRAVGVFLVQHAMSIPASLAAWIGVLFAMPWLGL